MASNSIYLLIGAVVLVALAGVYYIGDHLKRDNHPNSRYSEKTIALLLIDAYSRGHYAQNPCGFSIDEANYLLAIPEEKLSRCILLLSPNSDVRDTCLRAQKVFEFQQQEIGKRPAVYLGIAAIAKYLLVQRSYDFESREVFVECSSAVRGAG